MLTELHVRDLGVIEDVVLPFRPGLTALTGETGAGKTLLVEALVATLGGSSSATLVRAGADEAVIEGRFLITSSAVDDDLRGLDQLSLDGDQVELVLCRTIPAAGRSKAWVDGRMATLSRLSEVAGDLVDVHGQHEKLSLLRPAGMRRALDIFGGVDDGPLRQTRQALRAIDGRLAELGGSEQERAREIDMLRYQLDEIETAEIADESEDERLKEAEERLSDLSAYRQAAIEALDALAGSSSTPESISEGGASGIAPSDANDALSLALAALDGKATFGAVTSRLRDVSAEMADLVTELRGILDSLEDDPEQLASLQERRRRLGELRRKYGESLTDVLSYAGSARLRLAELEATTATAAALQSERVATATTLAQLEERTRRQRTKAADDLGTAVSRRLASLAMAGSRFEVLVGEDGAGEAVRFLLSANPGEPPRPLDSVVSGGELARTTLAFRLVSEGGPETVVFDEVDAGVGGEAALVLGAALSDVAQHHQVLVVTHLPQVAAYADHQVAVRKRTSGGRTTTQVTILDPSERLIELSRMLSGHPDSNTARAHAEELLARAQEARGARRTRRAV